MGKKALLAALTIASASSLIATEAFQPPASLGTSRSSNTDLNVLAYGNVVAYGRDQESKTNIEIEKPIHQEPDNHGYKVNNERSFWLHALQNLEPTTSNGDESLWAKIACAYGPKEFRETSSTIRKRDADLVRVGDTNLDITLAVPSESWNAAFLENNNVVSAISGRGNRQLVTIRVDFPEGSSFDKECFTFEDELTAVIGQVRLLEQTAENRLSKVNQ